ncbi:MAG: RDD family protein [Methanotrichaceae archaeon]
MAIGTLKPASWRDRFWAWVIDVMLMDLLLSQIRPILNIEPISLASLECLAVMLFIYWTVLDGYTGQSIGKMALKISVVGLIGEPIDYRSSALESFGKAFLLPGDCLVGWLKYPGIGQRYFNVISRTRVIYENGLLNVCDVNAPKSYSDKGDEL